MSEDNAETVSSEGQLKPYIIACVVIAIVVLTVVFWPTSERTSTSTLTTDLDSAPVTTAEPEQEPLNTQDNAEVFTARPEPQALEIDAVDVPEPQILEPQALPDPVIDESDGAVKSALVDVASSPHFAKYLVNESLLQKFVIGVNSLANGELSPNNALVQAPEQSFRIYKQAEREWIDASSFQRYNGYVDVLESLDTDALLSVFEIYRPTIEAKYAEISRPNERFDDALIRAIDELLDTPKVPVPIEVYSESVMYKFKDERLEALSGPQKQLIRTGPENMRRIKDVLREVKAALEQQ